MTMKPFAAITIILIFLSATPVEAIDTWWNTTWQNRYSTVLSNDTRPYQIQLFIQNSTIPFSNTTHVNISCNKPNCADIRFIADNITSFPYYRESNPSLTAFGLFWINVTTNSTGFQIYSNSTNGTDWENNATRTFRFNDSFTGAAFSTEWATGGSTSVTGGEAVIGNGLNSYAKTVKTFGTARAVRARLYATTTNNGAKRAIGFSDSATGNPFAGTNIAAAYWYGTNPCTGASLTCLDTMAGGTLTETGVTITAAGTYSIDEIQRQGTTQVNYYQDGNLIQSQATNIPAGEYPIWLSAQNNGISYYDWIVVRDYKSPEPAFSVAFNSAEDQGVISSWTNSYTGNNSLQFSGLTANNINYTINTTQPAGNVKWFRNNTLIQTNTTAAKQFNLIYAIPAEGVTYINASAYINLSGTFANISWNVTARNISLELLTPTNTSTGVATPVTVSWQQWSNAGATHHYYISTDDQFINIAASGALTPTLELYSTSVNLNAGTKYYWRVWNGSAYTATFEFTTAAAAITPGRLNITALDEQNGTRILTFYAHAINSTATLNKTTTTGWTNYTAAEVSASEYLIKVTAPGYATRWILATSPANVTVYLPNTANTINTIAFYLIDTTGKFPWASSKITISKNTSTMQSTYFDADTKSTAYLIQGDSYKITISYGSNIQEWGNYIPVSSGNVEILITDIGINATQVKPFVFNITYNTTAIDLKWSDRGTLNNLNFTISKGSSKTIVHQLITSISYGQSTYLITDLNSTYYISFIANTTQGTRNQVFAFDPRTGTISGAGRIREPRAYGTFTLPQWVSNAVCILIIIVTAGSFGAVYAGLGAVITIVFTIVFMKWGLLTDTGAGIGFIGGLAVIAILTYLRDRDTGTPSMMAYKAATFLIYFNFAVMAINGSGIIPTATVDVYGNDCRGANANTPTCFISRISSLAPQEVANDSSGMLQQITFVLVTATAFGLIILTLQYMLGLFWFGLGISEIYLAQLPIPWEFKLPLQAGALIIFVTGFMQYKAATSLRDKE